MKHNKLYPLVFLLVTIVLLLSLGWLLINAEPASGSCLRCFEPVPREHSEGGGDSVRPTKTAMPIPGYPGPLPPLPPTPDPYPGHSWASEMCPVPDKSEMGYHWERVPGGCG